MVPRPGTSRLVQDTRGAAYVEFLIAFLPILVFFLCIWQFGRIFSVRVLCAHAAIAGARAAAVVVAEPEDDGVVIHRVTDDKKQQITIAVYAALAPVIANDWLSSVQVDFPATRGAAPSSPADLTQPVQNFSLAPVSMLHVRVSTHYRCRLPFADILMCDHTPDGWTFPITAEGSFPYQAARYSYDPPTPQKPTEYDSATPRPK
jgi:TadE-like protein